MEMEGQVALLCEVRYIDSEMRRVIWWFDAYRGFFVSVKLKSALLQNRASFRKYSSIHFVRVLQRPHRLEGPAWIGSPIELELLHSEILRNESVTARPNNGTLKKILSF